MGYGTTCTADIYLSREDFANKYEVEQEIEECKIAINNVKTRLFGFICGNLKDLMPKSDEEEDPIYYAKQFLDGEMELLDKMTIRQFKLELLLDNWDTKTFG